MKRAATLVFAIALASASLPAQKSIQRKGNEIPSVEPALDPPATLTVIFSNLGKSNTEAYDEPGYGVNGPKAPGTSFTTFLAIPFKPRQNAHVEQVQAAVQYVSGTNEITLSLYSDNSGKPGALLAGPVTVNNLPVYFHCCALAVANFPASVAVTAGAQYWIAAETPAASDFAGIWSFVPSKLQVSSWTRGDGWQSTKATIEEPAGAAYGTVP